MVLRRLALPALCVLTACGLGSAAWGAAVPAPPAAQTFKLGALDLAVVRDGDIAEPNDGKVFGMDVGAAAVAKVLTEAGAKGDVVMMSIDILLVKTAGHVVLLDSGFGPTGHGVLLDSLAKVGVGPGDVTDVFITHGHRDHTGGLVGADGKSTFPKAKVRMSAKEWASIQANPKASAQLAAVAGQVATFEPDGRPVVPGITPVALYGHTPGHVGYEITSQGKTLLDVGDTVHSSIVSVIKPDWAEGYDADKVAGAAARRAELTRLAKSHAMIFVPHFPYPGIGQIEASGDAFRWKPATSLAW